MSIPPAYFPHFYPKDGENIVLLKHVSPSRRIHITSPKTLNPHALKNFTASHMSPFLVTSPHFLYLHLPTISQIMSSACLSNTSLNAIISFTHYLPTAGSLPRTFLPIPHMAQTTATLTSLISLSPLP